MFKALLGLLVLILAILIAGGIVLGLFAYIFLGLADWMSHVGNHDNSPP